MIPDMKHHSSKTAAEAPLLSNSSIFILSGFLIGIVATEMVPEAFKMSSCLGGVIGMIAYFSLQSVSRRNEQRIADYKKQQTSMKLESLVDKHIPRIVDTGRRQPFAHARTMSDRQYVTVPTSQRYSNRTSR